MSTPQTANDLLFAGGGAPALQWAHPDTQQDYPVGTSYEGEVVKTSAVRQRDLQVEQDSGLRSLWVSGKYLTNAVKDAVKKTGSHEIEEGGWLKVTLSGYGKPQTGFRPPRLFDVTYRRPSPEKRSEIQARKEAEAQAAQQWNQAGPMGDPSDPWAQPQNTFPTDNPWGTTPAAAPAPSARPAGPTPEAQALIDRMITQQGGPTA
jgi:hypothetical protein